jgi:twitching motility protein PilU
VVTLEIINPIEGLSSMDLTPYLKLILEKNGTDLFVVSGQPVKMRLEGQDKPVVKAILTPDMTKAAALGIMNDEQKRDFAKTKAVNFAYQNGTGNFEVAVMVENKAVALTIRPAEIPQAESEAEPEEEELSLHSKETEKKPEVKPAAADDNMGIELIDSNSVYDYLKLMMTHGGADLFVTVGSQLKAKIYGRARPLSTYIATPEIARACVVSVLTDEQLAQFEQTKDLDFAITMPDGSARFRGNAFFQRKNMSLVMRWIPAVIPNAMEMGLPEVLLELIMSKMGLLLMVGGTGSGKSTTLAAMIDHRNANSPGHILTIEDPVEFSHPNKMSIINQREVGVDTKSYATAIKASLREAPDVILIGEIRTEETMEAALELANTGHLCISTMHANNANKALERILNMFPTVKHKALLMDMSANIRAIISQRLIPDVRGKRVAAIEIMVNNPSIADLILKGDMPEIKDAMKSSGSKGMKTFDDALFDLYKAGKISLEEALKNADSRNDLEGRISFG